MTVVHPWHRLLAGFLRPGVRADPTAMLRRMGHGIFRRSSALRPYWESHLVRSQEIIREWLRAAVTEQGEAPLLVLGAGRGLDLPVDAVVASTSDLILADGDPAARNDFLSRNRSKVMAEDYLERELSGVLVRWSERLGEFERSAGWDSVLEEVSHISESIHEAESGVASLVRMYNEPESVRAISLNTLSQIPLLWQELVEAELRSRFGAGVVDANEEEWLTAVTHGARALVNQHLDELSRCTERTLLLTDIEYLHYTGVRPFKLRQAEELPFRLVDGEWRATSRAAGKGEVRCEVMPALFGIGVEAAGASRPGSMVHKIAEWEWHIQPLGYEDRSRGTIHRVAAFSIARRDERLEPRGDARSAR